MNAVNYPVSVKPITVSVLEQGALTDVQTMQADEPCTTCTDQYKGASGMDIFLGGGWTIFAAIFFGYKWWKSPKSERPMWRNCFIGIWVFMYLRKENKI